MEEQMRHVLNGMTIPLVEVLLDLTVQDTTRGRSISVQTLKWPYIALLYIYITLWLLNIKCYCHELLGTNTLSVENHFMFKIINVSHVANDKL